MVVQPLFRKLNSENILHKAYYKDNTKTSIILEIATKTKPYYKVPQGLVKEMLSGNQTIIPELSYELNQEGYNKIMDKSTISQFTVMKIENWLKEVYNFRETHRVTEYKNQ